MASLADAVGQKCIICEYGGDHNERNGMHGFRLRKRPRDNRSSYDASCTRVVRNQITGGESSSSVGAGARLCDSLNGCGRYGKRRQRGRRKARFVIYAVTAGLVLAACGGASKSTGAAPTAKRQLTPITFAVPGKSADFGYLWVAQQAGIFAKNGIRATLETLNGAAITAAVVSGAAQALPILSEAQTAALQGQPLTTIMATNYHLSVELVVEPGITSLSQLVGKTVVGGPPGSGQETSLLKLLAKYGLTGKVKVADIGDIPAIIAGYASGHTAGIMNGVSVAEIAMTDRPGSHVLVPASQNESFGQTNGLAVADNFLKAHPEVVTELVRSIYETLTYMVSKPAATERIFEQVFSETPAQAAVVYKVTKPMWVFQAQPTTAEYEAVAKVNSATLGKTITLAMEKKVWNTKIAQAVYRELHCNPNGCKS